ncbi:MAG: hypothetical protein KIS66_07335 [Fimbriimonadaceae bacterium]|nr:hypothetical protein [Fimbriimonadaceae bacterium]
MTDDATTRRTPWGFVPLLYFLESIPYVIVTTMSIVMYKKLGVSNEQIALWTSLVAWPWTLKMLWGPMVDKNSTKRRWVVVTQTLMILALAASTFTLGLPSFLAASLACFLVVALLSATHDIAADGFYLLALGEKDQAFFVGVRSTFYRLGTIFANGFLVYIAGQMETMTSRSVFVTVENHAKFVSDHPAGNVLLTLWYAVAGAWAALGDAFGTVLRSLVSIAEPLFADPIPRAWFLAIWVGIVVYVVAYLLNNLAMPKPAKDAPHQAMNPGRLAFEMLQILVMIFGILAIARQGYILYMLVDASFTGNWDFLWTQVRPLYTVVEGPADGFRTVSPVGHMPFWIEEIVALFVSVLAVFSTRRLFGAIGMGPAARSFFSQSRIQWVLGFVLFYRFGEIMIGKMSAPFLLDPAAKGGLAVPTSTVGTITGMWGVLGLTLGGILGGFVIAKWGIKRCLWPMVLSLNIPNLFYVWAAFNLPQLAGSQPAYVSSMVQWLIFADQFGYGFGFSAYMVYLMFVAQGDDALETSRYAIATGLMAFGAMVAGIVSGYAYKPFAEDPSGYGKFFVVVCLCTIPGMLTLPFIPMDKRDIKTAAIDID